MLLEEFGSRELCNSALQQDPLSVEVLWSSFSVMEYSVLYLAILLAHQYIALPWFFSNSVPMKTELCGPSEADIGDSVKGSFFFFCPTRSHSHF